MKKGYHHENHRAPMTRRDLLAQGFISVSAGLLLPSTLGMFSRRAYADDLVCSAAAAGGAKQVPFLIFDLAGGGNIAGTNVIVGDRGGQKSFLAAGSYATIGLAPAKEPTAAGVTVNEEYGLAFHPDSKILAGMNSVTATTTRANVDGAIFCTSSNDDTTGNPHSPLYWLAKAGMAGSLVPLVGTQDSASGGNSGAPQDSIDASKKPSRVAKPADSAGLVDPGTLATLLGVGGAADTVGVQKVMAAIKTMSDARLAQFQAQDVPTQIQDLIRCGYISSSDYLSKFSAAGLDPTKDTTVTGLYTNLTTNPTEAAAATIAKLVIDGYAGGGVVSIGGFDYHGQGRTAQDTQDKLAGRMIGLALELAARKKQPLMIYVYTDGGVSASGGPDTNGIYAFSSDSGQRSAAFTLVYSPTARPGVRNNLRQVGAFKTTGAVDETAVITGNNVENLSKAITANWLALHGREGDLAKAVGTDPFGSALDNYLVFNKIV